LKSVEAPGGMRRERLNEYSRFVADYLFRQWPEWEEFAKAIDYYPDDPELEPGTLVVKIKPPNPGIKERLEIWTYSNKVTVVAFKLFHTHFEWFDDVRDEAEHVLEAIRFLQDIISEEVKITAWRRRGKWIGGSYAKRDEQPDDSFLTERPDEFIQVSWNGTYDLVKKYET